MHIAAHAACGTEVTVLRKPFAGDYATVIWCPKCCAEVSLNDTTLRDPRAAICIVQAKDAR